MKRLLLASLASLCLLAPPALAAEQIQTPGQVPGGTQIPLDNSSAAAVEEEDNSSENYALLVIGSALLPLLAFAGYKIFSSSRTGKPERYRYSGGTADARSVRRRGQKKSR